MSTLTPQTTVGQFVAEQPARSRSFEKLGIKYCCGGQLSLAEELSSHLHKHEHAEAGAALLKLRELTGHYTPPEGACNSFRTLLDGLHQLERDTHEHISKENNILFPLAVAHLKGAHHA